jgi:ferritin-like metal-binding protein YciE
MRVQNGLRFLSAGCTTKDRNNSRMCVFMAHPTTIGAADGTNSTRDFCCWLRNAHAMEIQARALMERQSERLDEYPEVKAKVTAHLQETDEQLKRLEQCLDALGEGTSTLKDTTQSVMANVMAMTHAVAGDEIIKNTLANNAFENFEIAAYKSLLALCGPAGSDNARPHLQASLREEEQMAKWIDANVEKVTLAYLNREVRAAA